MASRIQGITVEIGGDTTKLSKALESVNKSIKGTQSGLKDVNKLLKLDPSNTELVVQKQKMLKDAIEATKEKLATLKTAAQQANEQLANGEITQQQYDALQREIVETEQNLRSLQDQAATTNATLAKIDEAGEKLQNIGSSVENAGLAAIHQILMDGLEAFLAIVIICINHNERSLDDLLRCEHSLTGSPRLCPTCRKFSRNIVNILKCVVHSYIVGLANGGNAITDDLFKLLLNILANNKYYMVETCLNRIVD